MTSASHVVPLLSAFIAAGSALAAWLAYRNGLRMGRRDALKFAADLHRDMTTGAVADARHVVGTKRYGNSDARRSVDARVIESYYVLLWAYERLATGVEVLKRAQYEEALEVLRVSIAWHVAEVGKNINALNEDTAVRARDAEAFERFKACVRQLKEAGIDPKVRFSAESSSVTTTR
ncbi:hypothetical protein [Rhodococcus sp. PvR099]|uniref:hypothetical protein n=1 Tax=Rhodococcus sp. PvR099 TaxID=2806602 RepID=UPI001AEB9B01|nr:hypothetical protein [Rhodococcus sp. PvR099]MBP1160946.1 hypothetical protein [Rhodococcus sp. PvR099]